MKKRLIATVAVVFILTAGGYSWHQYHTPEAYENRGYALQRDHQFLEAVGQFREAVRRRPGDAKLHSELGFALLQSGERPKSLWIRQDRKQEIVDMDYPPTQKAQYQALSEFREAMSLKPQYWGYHSSLGFALEKAVLYDQAIIEYRTALHLLPTTKVQPDTLSQTPYELRGNLHDSIGGILENRKDYAGAIREYQECVNYEPERLDVETDLAELLNQTGHRQEARTAWRNVLTKFAALYHYNYLELPYATPAKARLAKYPKQT